MIVPFYKLSGTQCIYLLIYLKTWQIAINIIAIKCWRIKMCLLSTCLCRWMSPLYPALQCNASPRAKHNFRASQHLDWFWIGKIHRVLLQHGWTNLTPAQPPPNPQYNFNPYQLRMIYTTFLKISTLMLSMRMMEVMWQELKSPFVSVFFPTLFISPWWSHVTMF